jgi:hypothetical protein
MKSILQVCKLVLLSACISLSGCGVEWFPDAKQPDPFSFEPQSNVATSTVVTSNKVTLVHNTQESVITIVNGEYSVDGGDFTTSPGKLKAGGGTLQVRHTSASTPGTATVTTVDISGRSATFTSVTATVPDSTPPSVVSTSPANGATGVAPTSPISITFSEAMDSATINTSNIKLAAGNSPISGTVSYTNLTATYTPSSALSTSTTYTLTVNGVKDLAGNSLTSQYSTSFTTGTTDTTNFITLGSPASDVKRIQGTPSSIDTYATYYVWNYDLKGSFTFSKATDTVTSWISTNNGLLVKMTPGSNTTNATAVTLGSSVDDVIRIQGTPSSIEDFSIFYIWRYDGKGSYTFSSSSNTVIAWGSLNHGLTVTIIPGSNTTNATTITVGSHVDDVARIQGTPNAIGIYPSIVSPTFYIWSYDGGSFTISSATNRVTSWDNTSGSLIVSGP